MMWQVADSGGVFKNFQNKSSIPKLSTERDISTQRDSKFDKAQNTAKQLFVAVSTNSSIFGSGRVVPVVLEESLGLIKGALSHRFYFKEAVVLFVLGLLDDLSALIYLVKLLGHPSCALVLNG
ncbi:hypothetical protein U9M48_027640 [Paspalum notatum var. saurae]|uniref:Uncharacterized protein n=1 Tax=Paspalum notatum var. saurae TaxID=547442 RepID=A0AAQ3X0N9_PASNO